MHLFDPNRHFKVTEVKWDSAKARNYLENIFCSTEASFRGEDFWKTHPNDNHMADENGPLFDLYMGAAGIIWGQKHLADQGYGEIEHKYFNFIDLAREAHHKNLSKKFEKYDWNNIDEYKLGLLLGDVGFLLAKLKFKPENELLQILLALAKKNNTNSILEYMWGSPGTITPLIRYKHYFDPQILRETVYEAIHFLHRKLVDSQEINCKIWKQNLYGTSENILGAVHGFAGNAFMLLKAFDFVSDKNYWSKLIRDLAKKSAITTGDFANWKISVDGSRPSGNDLLVQFCHGAPGIISCLSELIDGSDPEFDDLMVKGGNLVFEAGPLAKGSNLCHGTAGNGFAFLKLFTATKEKIWLDRARTFAMFAIQQSEEEYQKVGHLRFSLWTGDTGLAIFLSACLNANSDIPTMDLF